MKKEVRANLDELYGDKLVLCAIELIEAAGYETTNDIWEGDPSLAKYLTKRRVYDPVIGKLGFKKYEPEIREWKRKVDGFNDDELVAYAVGFMRAGKCETRTDTWRLDGDFVRYLRNRDVYNRVTDELGFRELKWTRDTKRRKKPAPPPKIVRKAVPNISKIKRDERTERELAAISRMESRAIEYRGICMERSQLPETDYERVIYYRNMMRYITGARFSKERSVAKGDHMIIISNENLFLARKVIMNTIKADERERSLKHYEEFLKSLKKYKKKRVETTDSVDVQEVVVEY